ncbi:hypothetical protein MGA3_15121 [Bacillus methanolicus MGA3]|nr:hypothetical protein MGA3_15121 [Bacillus methanolicus MGA3]
MYNSSSEHSSTSAILYGLSMVAEAVFNRNV